MRALLSDEEWEAEWVADMLAPWHEGENVCAFCGRHEDKLVLDHCHVTGWCRGKVCHGCNLSEARSYGDPAESLYQARWHRWRREAPLLPLREQYYSGWSGAAPTPYDPALDMDTIFQLHEESRYQMLDAATKTMEKIFG